MLCFLASKGAVEQISRVLAKDLGAKGITVNTVSPGPLDTAQFREGKSQKWIDFFSKQSPSNRLGLPEDVAPLVAFLSSPAAQWINGQNIRVNGVSLIFFCNTYPLLTIWIGFGIVTITWYTVDVCQIIIVIIYCLNPTSISDIGLKESFISEANIEINVRDSNATI